MACWTRRQEYTTGEAQNSTVREISTRYWTSRRYTLIAASAMPMAVANTRTTASDSGRYQSRLPVGTRPTTRTAANRMTIWVPKLNSADPTVLSGKTSRGR
jgi:hypothetical protein